VASLVVASLAFAVVSIVTPAIRTLRLRILQASDPPYGQRWLGFVTPVQYLVAGTNYTDKFLAVLVSYGFIVGTFFFGIESALPGKDPALITSSCFASAVQFFQDPFPESFH
jgi:hypothetical protein